MFSCLYYTAYVCIIDGMRAGGADIVFDPGTGIFQVRTERCGGRASSADVFLFENTVRGSRLCRPSGNTGIGGGGGLRRCRLLSGLSALEAEDMSGRFRYVVDGFLKNKTMVVVMIAFALTVIIVYLIRRLSIDHSWTIAIIAGTIAQMVVLLLGALLMDAEVSTIGIILGSLVSAGIAMAVEFLMFQMDYSRAENVCREAKQYSATLISDLEQIKKMSQGHV